MTVQQHLPNNADVTVALHRRGAGPLAADARGHRRTAPVARQRTLVGLKAATRPWVSPSGTHPGWPSLSLFAQ
jgi:hypothetical protein